MAGRAGPLSERDPVIPGRCQMKDEKKEFRIELVFLIAVFVFLVLWAVVQLFNASPDEAMRYQIVDFYCTSRHAASRRRPGSPDAMWGISYGFNPILFVYFFRRGLSKSHHFSLRVNRHC